MAPSESVRIRTYGNFRRPTTAGLLGLGSVGTAVLFAGLIGVVLVVMAAGLVWGAVTFTTMALVLAAVAVRDQHGSSILDRTTRRLTHQRAARRGLNLYRSGPLGMTPWGTCQLPGIAAPLKLSEHLDAYGRPFALIQSPATATYTVVISCEPDGAALVDQPQIDSWVADWGHWLANLGEEPGIAAASVTIETAPDTGRRLAHEVAGSIDPNAPAFARTMLQEIVDTYPAGSSTIQAWIAITIGSASTSGQRRTTQQVGRDLAARLPGLTGTLAATGAGAARLVDASELCEIVRVAYDPGCVDVIAQAHAAGQDPDLDWVDAGPAGHQADWDSYRHDSGRSVTWQMSTPPRGNVQSSVLSRLLAPHPRIDRKRVTWLYRPINPAAAAAMVEADLRAATFRATSTERPTARSVMDTRSAEATAAEEAAGAGLLNFGALITATVTDPERLPEARAAIDMLAGTARLRIRPCYGSQDSGFAAALPLGLVLPKLVSSVAAFKDKL